MDKKVAASSRVIQGRLWLFSDNQEPHTILSWQTIRITFRYSTCPAPLSGMENTSLYTQGYLSLSRRQSRDRERLFMKKLIFLSHTVGGQRFGCR